MQDVRQRWTLARSIPELVRFVNDEAWHPWLLAHAVHDVPVVGTGDGLFDCQGNMVTVGVEIRGGFGTEGCQRHERWQPMFGPHGVFHGSGTPAGGSSGV